MNDLEWYLSIGGKQSGPHAAREIVELVRSGKIPSTAQVTAARMSGDWVTAKDMVEAYDELFAKKTAEFPAFTNSASPKGDGSFQIPPRPTEQLERSKIINLSELNAERAPDPTDALFQAIQAVREKSQQKAVAPVSSIGHSSHQREGPGQVRQISKGGGSPQLILILTLAAIFGLTVYGIAALTGNKSASEAKNGGKNSEAKKSDSADTASGRTARSLPAEKNSERTQSNGLLDSGGSGSRSAAPSQVRNEPRLGNSGSNQNGRLGNSGSFGNSGAASYSGSAGNNAGANARPPTVFRTPPNDRLEKGGGARYRDERDPPAEASPFEGAEMDDSDTDARNQDADLIANPVDPSQVAPMNPDGTTVAPGAYPYESGSPQ
ncbi:MAG: DUF4339 domain-containing protein [Cryobacterium sp.]|nr:DUF4339 domain-containing protein [Oligoflexia bacterium]